MNQSASRVVCDNNDCYYKTCSSSSTTTTTKIKKEDQEEEETLYHLLVNQSKHFPREFVSLCGQCVDLIADMRQCCLCKCLMVDQWIRLFNDAQTDYCRECLPDKFIASFKSLRQYRPFEAANLLSTQRSTMRPDIRLDAMNLVGSLNHRYVKDRRKQQTRKREYEETLGKTISKWIPLLNKQEVERLVKHKLIDASVMEKTPMESLDQMSGLDFMTWLML